MKKTNSIIIILIMLCGLNQQKVQAVDLSKRLKEYNDPAVTGVTKLPSEFAFSVTGNYFSRNAKDSEFDPGASLFIGIGFIFDYNVSNNLAISYDNYLLFDQRSVYGSSKNMNFGLFIKYWISPSWGFIGLGFEFLNQNGDYNNNEINEKDYMLTFILTGENVKIRNRMNSIGDLRFSISLYDNTGKFETRYSIKYSIGVAFEL